MGMGFRGCEASGCLAFSQSHDLVVSFSIEKSVLYYTTANEKHETSSLRLH